MGWWVSNVGMEKATAIKWWQRVGLWLGLAGLVIGLASFACAVFWFDGMLWRVLAVLALAIFFVGWGALFAEFAKRVRR